MMSMLPLRLNPILLAIPTLVFAGIVGVGCGGNTSEDRGRTSQGDASTGGTDAGSAGSVSTGGGTGRGSGGQTGGGSGGGPGIGGHGGSGGTAESSGGGGTGGTEPPPILFGLLRLERAPAAGYCLQPGDILQAGIVYGETGDYSISGTVFREWDESRPDACWGIQSPDCVISDSFVLTLTGAQVAELGALLEALPEDRCEIDPGRECDPCLITTLVIDRNSYSDYCCGTQLSPGYDGALGALVNFLDGVTATAS